VIDSNCEEHFKEILNPDTEETVENTGENKKQLPHQPGNGNLLDWMSLKMEKMKQDKLYKTGSGHTM
jgi:hypothetical protein